jgi:hypothetical protein
VIDLGCEDIDPIEINACGVSTKELEEALEEFATLWASYNAFLEEAYGLNDKIREEDYYV